MTHVGADLPPLLFSPRSPSPSTTATATTSTSTSSTATSTATSTLHHRHLHLHLHSQLHQDSSYTPTPTPRHPQMSLQPQPQPQPQDGEDVDMSMSMSITLPPQGQNHDRDSDVVHMDVVDAAVASAGNTVSVSHNSSDPSPNPDDAMDTTPDEGELRPVAVVLPTSATTAEPDDGWGNSTPNRHPPPSQAVDGALPANPPHPLHSEHTPPPPGPSRSPSPSAQNGSGNIHDLHENSDTDDDDDANTSWHEITEDSSVPDEQELKEIEAQTEHSAADHAHWQAKTFLTLDDPEYSVGESGIIEWTVTNYNGTKDKPNRDLVMFSPVINIGGVDWRIKFYPRGNDTEHLSVYLECVSLDPPDKLDSTGGENSTVGQAPDNKADPTLTNLVEPLPALPNRFAPLRPAVSAQMSFVLYNPDEPRVNYFRRAEHKFCPKQSDWGFTRFHGPYYEIQHRIRGQRQALMRNDTLAFTAYVRIIHDKTRCLWEHDSGTNPWDSYAMIGLPSLVINGRARISQDGGVISLLSTLMLLRPFRKLLYDAESPDPNAAFPARAKPLLKALQCLLYAMRTPSLNTNKTHQVDAQDVLEALRWYGIDKKVARLDVVQIWHVLRQKLDFELRDTPYSTALNRIFGEMTEPVARPSFRIPVKGVSSVQEGLDLHMERYTAGTPEVVTVELERQVFQESDRSWKKLVSKVKLDDEITILNVRYELHSFVVHKDSLQSGRYQSVSRPWGPNGKWYNFQDSRDENKVLCLTTRQAVDAHQGVDESSDETLSVAYLATYVRLDVFADSVERPEPEWQVPGWLEDDVQEQREALTSGWAVGEESDVSMEDDGPSTGGAEQDKSKEKADSVREEQGVATTTMGTYLIIDSRAFLDHGGPGFCDAYNIDRGRKWCFEVQVPQYSSDKCIKEAALQQAIAAKIEGVTDPRQCRVRPMQSGDRTDMRPCLRNLRSETDSLRLKTAVSEDEPVDVVLIEHRIWVHVVDAQDLPPLPKKGKNEAPSGAASTKALGVGTVSGNTGAGIGQSQLHILAAAAEDAMARQQADASNDTVMSDADDSPTVADGDTQAGATTSGRMTIMEILNESPLATQLNATMPGSGSSDLHAVLDVLGHAVMDMAVPNSADGSASATPVQPASYIDTSDEIYFFLKTFDAETQSLIPKGSYMESRKSRVDKTVGRILGLNADADALPEMLEEADLTHTTQIRRRKTFGQESLSDACIIIVAPALGEDAKSGLRQRGHATTPQELLEMLAFRRNFPAAYEGRFVQNYFSAERYTGEMLAGHAHGHGCKTGFDGSTYTGPFVMGARHGDDGTLVSQNGNSYTGSFAGGVRHGRGTFTDSESGNVYEGSWRKDKKWGEGVTRWKRAQESERTCNICWDEEASADACFYDCGHVVACLACARRVDVCPVCRRKVVGSVRVWYVN